MKLTEFDTTNLKQLRSEIEATMATISQKYNIALKLGSCRYSPQNFTFKLEGAVVDKDGQSEDLERVMFKQNAPFWSLKPEMLDAVITVSGDKYKIIGLQPKRRKYPVIVLRLKDSRKVLFQVQTVVDNYRP